MNMNCSSLVVVLMVVLGCTPAMSQPSIYNQPAVEVNSVDEGVFYDDATGNRQYLLEVDTQPRNSTSLRRSRSVTHSQTTSTGTHVQSWIAGNPIDEFVNYHVRVIRDEGTKYYHLNGWAVNGEWESEDHPLIQEHLRRKLQDPTSGGSPPQNEHVQCKTFFGPVLNFNVECEVAYITGPGRISVDNHYDYHHNLTREVYDVSGGRVSPVKCGTKGSGTTYLEVEDASKLAFASQNVVYKFFYATTGSA